MLGRNSLRPKVLERMYAKRLAPGKLPVFNKIFFCYYENVLRRSLSDKGERDALILLYIVFCVPDTLPSQNGSGKVVPSFHLNDI
jgi:hypothetical protein